MEQQSLRAARMVAILGALGVSLIGFAASRRGNPSMLSPDGFAELLGHIGIVMLLAFVVGWVVSLSVRFFTKQPTQSGLWTALLIAVLFNSLAVVGYAGGSAAPRTSAELTGVALAAEASNPRSSEELVSVLAERINQSVPQRHSLPDGTRMTLKMATASGVVLTYHYDFDDFIFDSQTMNLDALRDTFLRTTRSQLCAQSGVPSFTRAQELGIRFRYTYSDAIGRHLHAITIDPRDC